MNHVPSLFIGFSGIDVNRSRAASGTPEAGFARIGPDPLALNEEIREETGSGTPYLKKGRMKHLYIGPQPSGMHCPVCGRLRHGCPRTPCGPPGAIPPA